MPYVLLHQINWHQSKPKADTFQYVIFHNRPTTFQPPLVHSLSASIIEVKYRLYTSYICVCTSTCFEEDSRPVEGQHPTVHYDNTQTAWQNLERKEVTHQMKVSWARFESARSGCAWTCRSNETGDVKVMLKPAVFFLYVWHWTVWPIFSVKCPPVHIVTLVIRM